MCLALISALQAEPPEASFPSSEPCLGAASPGAIRADCFHPHSPIHQKLTVGESMRSNINYKFCFLPAYKPLARINTVSTLASAVTEVVDDFSSCRAQPQAAWVRKSGQHSRSGLSQFRSILQITYCLLQTRSWPVLRLSGTSRPGWYPSAFHLAVLFTLNV